MARRRKRSGAGRFLALLLVLAAIGLGGVFYLWRGPGPLAAPTTIVVREGETLSGVTRALATKGAIRSDRLFRGLARVFGSGDGVRAGEFAIPAHASAAAILDVLQHGRPALHLVAIAEGLPSVIVRDKVMAAKGLTGSVAVPADGSVLPDSYAFRLGEPRAAVVARMKAAMDRTLAEAWKSRAGGLVVTSPAQTLVLASIVEKETALPAERSTVAAVYANRLRAGMPLQADPTIIYPITHGRPLGRRIRESEVHAVNGYNTYAMRGLPVGPICNPGRASITAVLHPSDSRALYFVADGKGGHVFANTLAEHSANVRKWYAIRHARGEM